jgi:hypothetical protein
MIILACTVNYPTAKGPLFFAVSITPSTGIVQNKSESCHGKNNHPLTLYPLPDRCSRIVAPET